MELSHLPDDYLKPLIPCFDLLTRCNMGFFDENSSYFKRYWRYSYVTTCVIAYYTSLTVYALQIFQGQMELFELAYVVPVFVVCTQAILKAIIVIIHKGEIRTLVLQLGETWRTDNLTTKQLNKKTLLLKKLKFCYGAFYWMNIIGSWQYILAPLVETIFRKYILNQEFGLALPFACSFPFDASANWPTYIAVYVFETYSMFRIVYSYLGTEFLLISLCSHLSTEFCLLREDLLNVKPIERRSYNILPDCRNMELHDIVMKHQKLIKFSEQLNDIFNKMIFINLSSVTITVCFFAFATKNGQLQRVSRDCIHFFIMEKLTLLWFLISRVARGPVDMANNFVAVVALILPIFNLCYYAEMLINASAGVAESAYHNLWYMASAQYQKSIWFIIRRSQKPCCLTSLKFDPVALHTFTTVLSTTWSYFSLASTLFENEN